MILAAVCAIAAPAHARQAMDPAGYLDHAAIQALANAVAPAPVAGSPRDLADIAASDRLRALENTDRWMLATRHAELRPALALAHFDCALGFRLTAEDSPRLVSILERILHDANEAAELAKARAFRARPVGADPERPACTVVSPAGRASPSWPSGSATVGSAYGEAIAALAPEHATEAARIGHEIGVSRMVCAMHYPSDVAEGETLGKAAFQRIAATPAYQADAVVAREEVARARAAGLTSPACAAERAALATPLP
ncbi:phosphatase PAP2 family protein [Brevundimonas sp.]|uniref:phosphatase PAP2 family protein n=1 Tax=Brevundimonas sp. TaxID=1871086 RepID=UPI0026357706|nr:phosphatase PAP2 family protein [Brevundimonas sp.]